MIAPESRDESQAMEVLEAILEDLERSLDPGALEKARNLLAAVLDLHRRGLARMFELADRAGLWKGDLLPAVTGDPLVASLLMLHDLHPDTVEVRARRAIDGLGAELEALEARAEVVAIDEKCIHVRLVRAANPSARRLLEVVLEAAAPEAAIRIDEEVRESSTGLVSLEDVRRRARDGAPR